MLAKLRRPLQGLVITKPSPQTLQGTIGRTTGASEDGANVIGWIDNEAVGPLGEGARESAGPLVELVI